MLIPTVRTRLQVAVVQLPGPPQDMLPAEGNAGPHSTTCQLLAAESNTTWRDMLPSEGNVAPRDILPTNGCVTIVPHDHMTMAP